MTYLVVKLQTALEEPSNLHALSNSLVVHCRVYLHCHGLQFGEHPLEFRVGNRIVAGWRLSAKITEKEWIFADSLNRLRLLDSKHRKRQLLTFTTRSRKESALFRSASRFSAQMVSDDKASIPLSAASHEAVLNVASPRMGL